MTQGDVPTGVTEIYPKSGNSPWVQIWNDIVFPAQSMEKSPFYTQTVYHEKEEGTWYVLNWLSVDESRDEPKHFLSSYIS